MKSEVIFENYNNFSPARKLAGLEKLSLAAHRQYSTHQKTLTWPIYTGITAFLPFFQYDTGVL